MEQNFETSFIPKKPMIEERVKIARPAGLLIIISVLILFTSLLATGGLFFYKNIETANITQKQNDINLAKSRFEPSKITELQVLDRRLRASSEILSNHIAITPIFQSLAALTMRNVQYLKFGYTLGDDGKIVVKMSGIAVGYRSIALQSDLYLQNKSIIDPAFSNLTLDDSGNVLFDLIFSVDPSFVNYKQSLLTQN